MYIQSASLLNIIQLLNNGQSVISLFLVARLKAAFLAKNKGFHVFASMVSIYGIGFG